MKTKSFYACEFCGKLFRRKRHAFDHYTAHMGGERFSCDVCEKKFVRSRALTIHRRKHEVVKPKKGKKCKNGDSGKQASGNDNGLTVKCDICHKKFTTELCLFRHKMVHKSTPNKDVDKNLDKDAHKNVHKDAHKHLDKDVDKDAHKDLDTDVNKDVDKNLDKDGPHECPACRKKCKYKRSAKYHCKPRAKLYPCTLCNMGYTVKASLIAHLKAHKPVCYNCDTCGNEFISKLALADHEEKIHKTAEIPHAMCETKFTSEDSLQLHTEVHHIAKPHICDICGKEFINKENLHNHLLVHQNKHLICDTCGERFNDNLIAFKHRLTHKQQNRDFPDDGNISKKAFKPENTTAILIPVRKIDKLYKCNMCGEEFLNKCVRKFHIAINHKVNESDISNLQDDSQPTQNNKSYEEHDDGDISNLQNTLITPKSCCEPINRWGKTSSKHVCGMCGHIFSGNEEWYHLRRHQLQVNMSLIDILAQKDHSD